MVLYNTRQQLFENSGEMETKSVTCHPLKQKDKQAIGIMLQLQLRKCFEEGLAAAARVCFSLAFG